MRSGNSLAQNNVRLEKAMVKELQGLCGYLNFFSQGNLSRVHIHQANVRKIQWLDKI